MKNTDLNNPLSNEDQSLTPELLALANDLDRLAAHEGASADASLADRIFLKTRSAVLHEGMTPEVRRVHDGMAAVGVHERSAAPRGLEQRVFDATVDQIARPVVLATIGTRRWASLWAGRLAIAAGLAIAAVGGWTVLSQSTPTTTGTPNGLTTNTSPANSDAVPKVAIVPATELEEILESTEAEDSFVALFAFGDDLGSDISAAASEAARVEKALIGEQASGG